MYVRLRDILAYTFWVCVSRDLVRGVRTDDWQLVALGVTAAAILISTTYGLGWVIDRWKIVRRADQ